MAMSIDESGHERLSAAVQDACIPGFPGRKVPLLLNRCNPSVSNHDGIPTGPAGVHGENVGVAEDQIGHGLGKRSFGIVRALSFGNVEFGCMVADCDQERRRPG